MSTYCSYHQCCEFSHSPFPPNHHQQQKVTLSVINFVSSIVGLPNPLSLHTINHYNVTINPYKFTTNFSRLNILSIKISNDRTNFTVRGLRNYFKHLKQSLTHISVKQSGCNRWVERQCWSKETNTRKCYISAVVAKKQNGTYFLNNLSYISWYWMLII